MNSVYSLQAFIAFLLHVAVSHSPSSGRNLYRFTVLYHSTGCDTGISTQTSHWLFLLVFVSNGNSRFEERQMHIYCQDNARPTKNISQSKPTLYLRL